MPKKAENWEALGKSPMRMWKGWALYHWDMAHCVTLFNNKPQLAKWSRPTKRWVYAGAIEGISVGFLQACGVPWPYDGTEEFYYGDNRAGEHPPIEIELRLPEALLEQLGLL